MIGILLDERRARWGVTTLEPVRRETGRRAPHLGHSRHERRVAAIAVRLFDLTAAEHHLGERHREILTTAALVHDAAKPAGAAGHEVRGAAMVMADRTSPLTGEARRFAAFLVRYHRGDVPESGCEDVLLPNDRREPARVLLAMLRVADALDKRGMPAAAIILSRRGRAKLVVRCLVAGDKAAARRALDRPNKFKLLKQTLGLRVRVQVTAVGEGDD